MYLSKRNSIFFIRQKTGHTEAFAPTNYTISSMWYAIVKYDYARQSRSVFIQQVRRTMPRLSSFWMMKLWKVLQACSDLKL